MITILVVYVDDIVVIGNDRVAIKYLIAYLTKEFELWNQRSWYVKLRDLERDCNYPNTRFVKRRKKTRGKTFSYSDWSTLSSWAPNIDKLLNDLGSYQRLVGKLNYQQSLSRAFLYVVSVVNQLCMHQKPDILMPYIA